jgi:putative zinc finger/helix-turn-helix YgiT family protein
MMKTPERKKSPAKTLPDDACPACGAAMKERRGTLKLPVNGEEIAVPGASHRRCPSCGETVLGLDQARRLHEAAHALYRQKHGLLSADEIRALREQLGVTQNALAALLRLGSNTLSRWESGRNVQTASMDVLLRMLRDVPGTVDYLQRRAA